MYSGWYLVAFESDLVGDLTPVSIGYRSLILVRGDNHVRAFDAVCPHRGANLAFGGCLDGEAIVCPFHSKRILLGEQRSERYWVREYPVLGYGGMLFVRLSDEHENGLGKLLEGLAEDHLFVPCFALAMHVSADLVTENAFDETHFRPVHGVGNEPHLMVRYSDEGALIAEASFDLPVNQWQLGDGRGTTVRVPFTAHAFSPHLVISHMGGDHSYWTITGATPKAEQDCVIRFGLAVPSGRGSSQAAPSLERIKYLARQSRGGIEQDQLIWENLRPLANPRYAPEDGPVIRFKKFCKRFIEIE